MKKIILAVFLTACLALPALADSPVPGWWVQTEGSEGTKFTDIQDDFLALQAEIDALEQMGGIPGPQGGQRQLHFLIGDNYTSPKRAESGKPIR